MTTARSWRMEVIADSSGEWATNSLRFPDEESAQRWGMDLARRWTLVREVRAMPSMDTVNVDRDGRLL